MNINPNLAVQGESQHLTSSAIRSTIAFPTTGSESFAERANFCPVITSIVLKRLTARVHSDRLLCLSSSFCALAGTRIAPGFSDLVGLAECCSGPWARVPDFISQGRRP
jgi:hypothetical protein